MSFDFVGDPSDASTWHNDGASYVRETYAGDGGERVEYTGRNGILLYSTSTERCEHHHICCTLSNDLHNIGHGNIKKNDISEKTAA